MPGWVKDILNGGPIFALAKGLWNFLMSIVNTMMGTSPEKYSTSAWVYISTSVYPWFLSMGAVFLNLFYMIGFCRQMSNLKENVTMEMLLELFIKVIIANVLLQNGLAIMQEFTDFASGITGGLMGETMPGIAGDDYDIGVSLAMTMLAPIYLILAAVCGITILIEVMGRFLNLYMLIAVAPLSLSTLAGGRGIENTSIAWFKSFLTSVFQIAVIALVLRISSMIISSNLLTAAISATLLGDWFDGAASVIMSLVTMPFMATAVKASDNFLKRAFNLQ